MSEEKPKVKEVKLEIQADEKIANGVYSNFVIANQTETEFMLDFVFVAPQTPKAKVLSRVILNPTHAKRLMLMLNKQVASYEQRYGEITIRQAKVKANKEPGPDSGGFIN